MTREKLPTEAQLLTLPLLLWLRRHSQPAN